MLVEKRERDVQVIVGEEGTVCRNPPPPGGWGFPNPGKHGWKNPTRCYENVHPKFLVIFVKYVQNTKSAI